MADSVVSTESAGRVEREMDLRRDINRLGLLFASVGSIIGSGWLFGTLYASQIAGPASLISWGLGGIMVLFIALVYAELGAMFPVSGGVVRFPQYAFGSLASYTVGWITWLAAVTVAPIEVEAALQYATNYIGWLTTVSGGTPVLTPGGYAVAVGLMGLFSFINVMGVKAFSDTNTVLVWWKLAVPSLVIASFIVLQTHPSHLTGYGGFAPSGAHGIFQAIATAGIVFSYLGFRQGVELAGESRNPQRDVPFAVIGSVLVTIVIYELLQLAFLFAVPGGNLVNGWANLAFSNDFGPLAGIATLIGLGWLAVLLYIDAVISPMGTGLIYTTVTARISYAMGRNRNAPSSLARVGGRGVPWVSVAMTFLMGLVVFLPFPGWQKLVGFITSATVLSFGSGPLALSAMRRQIPSQNRPYRLPVADGISFLAFYSSNLIVFWAGWETDWKLFVAIGIGFILLAVHTVVRKDEAPSWELRAASWVVPWLGGLMVLSWLSSYGGGRGTIGLGWGFLWIGLLSAAVFWLAVAVRLSPERVREEIEEAPPRRVPSAGH